MAKFIQACRSGDVKRSTFLLDDGYVNGNNSFNEDNSEISNLVKFLYTEDSLDYDGLNPSSLLVNYNQHKQTDDIILIYGEIIIENGLIIVCQFGHLELAKLMVRYGSKIFNNGLLFASLEGHMEIAKYMISLGADNLNGSLLVACSKGHFNIAEYMITIGATNVDDALEELSITAIEAKECKEFIETFLLKTTKKHINDCFQLACEYNNLMIAKLLVEHGADVFNRGLFGACLKRFPRIVQFALKCGAINYQEAFELATTLYNFDKDEENAILLLQNTRERIVCDNYMILIRLLERGVDIEKISSTHTMMKIKDTKQIFRDTIQNLSTSSLTLTIPKELLNMISEYSLF